MKLRAIIVEDEVLGQEVLTAILQNYCAESVELLDVTASVEKSIQSIRQHNPHIVFLDIMLGNNENGAFDILRGLDQINFKVVFTTSSEQPTHILKALNKYGAKKYLLKPLDIDEVVGAVEIVRNELKSRSLEDELKNIKMLINSISHPEMLKVNLPVRNGFQYVPFDEIIMFRSNQNSTLVFLTSGDTLSTSKNLKHIEEHFSHELFIRVSKSHIVNISHVEKYCNEDGGTIYLHGGCSAPLSETYSAGFFDALEN